MDWCGLHFRVYWRNQSYFALHHQQEQFENAVQEHHRIAYDQIEMAAFFATIRTALKIILRRTSVINNEEYFPKLLPIQPQRRTLFQEATAWMIRRETPSMQICCPSW